MIIIIVQFQESYGIYDRIWRNFLSLILAIKVI